MSKDAMETKKEFTSPAEIARQLCVTSTTVYRWIQDGVFPNALQLGRSYRVPTGDVENWLKNSLVVKHNGAGRTVQAQS